MDKSDTVPKLVGSTFSTTTKRMLSSLKSIRSTSRESKNRVTAVPQSRLTFSEHPEAITNVLLPSFLGRHASIHLSLSDC